MSIKNNVKIVPVIIIILAAFLAVRFFLHLDIFEEGHVAAWREEFIHGGKTATGLLPVGWQLQKKPGTKAAIFSIKDDPGQGGSFLHMEANNASASLITRTYAVDIAKAPILRWRWRATALPAGADSRVKSKDDQAIGIYIGTGSLLNNKSISYRWDTQTPKGSEGNYVYGVGTIKVKWYTLRNEEDLKNNGWFTEERNVVEDFKNAWGFCPETIYLGVSCNSQYTKSQAGADLDWIEFINVAT